jgi:hypothetical protein
MSIKDCLQLAKGLDPEDSAAIMAQQKDLVASGVPGNEAWTQAAELVMDNVLAERNALAGEIAEKGGYLQVLDIENLLNPASYGKEDADVHPDAAGSWFHGTYEMFEQFDPEMRGAETGAEDAKMAFFFARDHALAGTYAPEINPYTENKFWRMLDKITRGMYQKANEALLKPFGISGILPKGRVMQTELSLKNPKILDLGGAEYSEKRWTKALQEARDAGHDGVILKNVKDTGFVEGDTVTDVAAVFDAANINVTDQGSAMRRQAPGANQRKGTLSTLKQEYPAAHEAVQRRLRRMPKKEAAMIRRNLKEHEGTGWAASAVKSLVIRDVFDGLMKGRDVQSLMDSPFWGKDPLSRYTMTKWLKKGPAGVEHLIRSYTFIGTNRKAENDVAGSFLNCEPSRACAQHCYAVSANGRTVELMKAEFTELAAKMFPEEVATVIAHDYKHSPAGLAGLSLRINDKGDLSDAQVDVINRLNKKGVALQVFSKRPELLRKLSDVNLKMLSVDETNFNVALENKDLNLAVTLTDGFTQDMVKQVNDRVSVYLPVNLRGKAWDTSTLKAMFPTTFRDMANKLCPVEAGKVTTKKGISFVDIPAGLADGNWTCTACDLLGAVGCFHKDRKTDNRKAAMGLFEITVNEAQNEADTAIDQVAEGLLKLQKTGAIDANTVNSTLAELRDSVRIPQQGNDPDPEATGVEGREPENLADTGEREEDGGAARRTAPEVSPPENNTAHRRQVGRWLKKPLKRLQNRVPIIIKNDVDEVDFYVPPKTGGFKKDGKVYLFRDNLRTEQEAVEGVTHEVIGHLGLEGSLGKRKFDELIGDVSNIMVEIMMDSSGKLHPKVRAIQAELRKYYVDEKGNFELNPRDEAREILAHIAHSKPRLGRLREIYNKIAAWIGQWAAQMGMVDPDMARIESLLVSATDYVLDPARAVAEDFEQGAAMRRQETDTESQEDKELADALGLGGKERKSFIKRMRALTSEGMKTALRTAGNRTYEGLFDGLIEMQRKEKEAGVGLGKEITYMAPDRNGNPTIRKKTFDYENSAYVAARLATGISDMMTYLLNYGGLQWDSGIVKGVEGTRGFKDIMKELGVDNLKPWLIWMAGNRANQLMAEGRERNLSQAQIDLAMSKNQGKEELFNKIKDEYNKLNQLQLDFAQEAGLIDADKRAEWDSEWYVPFYRQSDEDRTLGPNTKRGLSHQSAGIMRLMGGDVPTADLFENIMANWIKLTDASVKNHALRLMVDNFKDTEYISDKTADFKKAMVPKTELHKFIKENREFAHRLADWLNLDRKTTADGIWDAVSELDPAGLEKLWQVVAPSAPDIVRVQRNGKNEYHQIHTPGLLRAVGHMTPREWQSSGGMRAARFMKTLLTTGVTVSPDFMIRNFIRDAAHSWAINKDNMFFLKDSIKGLEGAATANPIHRAMMAAGASFQGGYVHGTNPEATAEIMRRELIKAGWKDGAITSFLDSIIDTPGKLSRVSGLVWQKYREAGDRIENASRVATAEAGRKSGKPMAQWLFESKDLMDYSRRGNAGALIFLTDVMPFLNARIQGLQKLGRATKEDPMIVSKKLAMIAGFSVFLAMLNDDDDDYQELPDWEKDAYWHVFPHFNGKKQHIRIPKPFEIGFVAGTMPERMWRAWVTETQPSEKVKWALMHGIKETLNINIYPQIILPIAELKANRHFYFDQPIESEHERKNVIPKERYNQYTSETAIMLASGLDNPLTRWLEMSPKQVQHLWNGYTGTMGAYLLAATDMLATNPLGNFPTPEEIQLEDIPAIKSLYKGQRKRTTQWQVDVYDRIQEVNQIYGTLKKYREEAVETGDKTKYTEFKAKHYDKLKARKTLVRAQKNFSKLRKLRERILKDDSLTGAQKYQQSQAIQVRINALAKKIEGATREGF